MNCEVLLKALVLLIASDMTTHSLEIGISPTLSANISSAENSSTTTLVVTSTEKPPTTVVTKTASPVATTATTLASTTSTTKSTTTPATAVTRNITNATSPSSSFAAIGRKSSTYYCGCDTKLNLCDINCCCDIDCSDAMVKAFVCDDKYQTLYDFQYQQGLPSCTISKSWLCVFRDNSKKEPEDIYNAMTRDESKYGWPDNFVGFKTPDNDREYYKAGDLIIVYDEQAEKFKTFDLPYSLLNPYCQVFEPIRHLKDFTRNCLVNLDQSQDYFAGLLNFKLLKSRKRSLNSELMMDESNLIDVHLYQCFENSKTKNCRNITNSTLTEITQNGACSKLDITVHHNFTTLLSCRINFTCSREDSFEENIWKTFTVKFLQPNETDPLANNVRDQSGYQTGHPLIRGVYVPINDTVEESKKQLIIDYFHDNATIRGKNHRIFLPKSEVGFCSEDISEQINFNENTLTQCYITVSNETSIKSDSNHTKICEQLQKIAFNYLINNPNFTEHFDIYVWASPINVSADWIKIEMKNFDVIKVLGTYSQESNSISCHNMIINVKYEFLISRSFSHHNTIEKAFLEFGKRVDLQFKLEEDLKIPLRVHVMFYDVTNSKIKNRSSLLRTSDNIKLIEIILTLYFLINNII